MAVRSCDKCGRFFRSARPWSTWDEEITEYCPKCLQKVKDKQDEAIRRNAHLYGNSPDWLRGDG